MTGQPAPQLEFSQWANFYIATSAAAATSLGLLFVVIALGSDRGRPEDAPKIKIYLTPVVVYFCSVLFLSLLLAVPNQTRVTAVICVCLNGLAGLVYSGSLGIRRGTGGAEYQPGTDLLPYTFFPAAAYAVMVAGGVVFLARPAIGLDLVAAGMLVLLGIAIRNSWAIATSIVSSGV